MDHFNGFSQLLVLVQNHLPDDLLDVQKLDVMALQRPVIWTSRDRPKARETLETVVFGVADIQGLPRVPMPASWIAAAVAVYVHECNWMAACYDLSTYTVDVREAADRPGDHAQRMGASRLFSLVCEHSANDPVAVREARDAMAARVDQVNAASV